MLSIHSFHTKVLNTKTYDSLAPFTHVGGKNLEELAALLLTRNGKTYIHAYIYKKHWNTNLRILLYATTENDDDGNKVY